MLIQVSLKAVHKEICQKKKRGDADLTEISFRGQFKLETPTLASLRGLNNKLLIFRRAALHFYMKVLPGITDKYRHINSDDFGGHLV